MRRQQRALSGRDFGNENIGIRALGLLLGVNDVLSIFRPDRSVVSLVLRRVRGEVLHLAHHHVVDVDLIGRGSFRLHFIRQVAAVRRPRRIQFGDLARLGEVHDLARLRRNQKNVPLLVAVVVRLVGDPFSVRRPRRRRLPLVADRQLHRPSAFGRHEPQIIPSAHVGDEGDALAIGRPRGPAHLPRHVELLDGQTARVDLRVGLRRNLLRIGNGLGAGRVWAAVSATTVLISMTITKGIRVRMGR